MKALIVDESGTVRTRLEPALRQEGYVVSSAESKGEARWLAGEDDTDVVIVCSSRPGVHDVPAVEALREDGERAPILVLARRADSEDRIRALDAGADDVVVSPVPFAEVAARLRALRRRKTELESDDVTVGTLRLDRAMLQAVRETPEGPATIDLTTREFAMLDVMMRHPGHVLSRTRLLEHVWGAEVDVASNLVDQVVSHLRAKVDRPFGCSDLRTVRGVGYRFGGPTVRAAVTAGPPPSSRLQPAR